MKRRPFTKLQRESFKEKTMTASEWRNAITHIESLRYQLDCNIMSKIEREALTRELAASLRQLAEKILPSG
jgi:hypothetical protein